MKRREFLSHSLALLALATSRRAWSTTQAREVLLSAATDNNGKHWLIGIDTAGINAADFGGADIGVADISGFGSERYRLALPSRGHALGISPDQQRAVAVARRPGRYLIAFNPQTGERLGEARAPANRHFYGHGVFSADGTRLYVTANDYSGEHADESGLVMVYDSHTLRLIDEWRTGGIGPHELLRAGNELIVANGGIETHPDSGRSALNLDSMHGSVVWMNADNGKIEHQHQLPRRWRLSSPRHMGLIGANHEQIAVVMQYQGNSRGQAPLVAIADRESGLNVLSAPLAVQRKLKDYCGSVVADVSGEQFAVSSPRGNRLTIWSSSGEFLNDVRISDVCGLAPTARPGEWLASDGNGRISRVSSASGQTLFSNNPQLRWDNHLVGTMPG